MPNRSVNIEFTPDGAVRLSALERHPDLRDLWKYLMSLRTENVQYRLDNQKLRDELEQLKTLV